MAYIVGTYGLKFYKELTNERGVTVRLEIHQRSWTGRTIEIAKLDGLNFFLQGSQDNIDTPIVKSSAKFGIVDNPFESNLDSDGEKYINSHWVRFTNWTEFYTPDSTKYLVKLYHNGRTLWSGYITPDSYQESLDAFGSIQITARDNLGHLQDFEFDMAGDSYGLVNVRSLIEAAFTKIAFPMNTIYQDQADDNELRSEDDAIGVRDLCVNVTALEGMDWYEVLEEVLNSLGWCIRFCDVNAFEVGPLRHIARYGWRITDDPPMENVQFIGRHSGTRTFDPAYKQIIEKVDFGQENKSEADILAMTKRVQQVGSTGTTGYVLEAGNDQAHLSSYHQGVQGCCGDSESGYFPIKIGPFQFENGYNVLAAQDYALQDATEEAEGSAARDYIYIAANVGYTSGTFPNITYNYSRISKTFKMKVMSPAVKFEFEFADYPMCMYDGKLGAYPYRLKKIVYQVKYTSADGNTERYWNGYMWTTTSDVWGIDLEQEFDPLNETGNKFGAEMSACDECGAYGTLEIVIVRIQYQPVGGYWQGTSFVFITGYGCWARLRSFYIESAAAKVMKTDTVTTVVNESYNVTCKRTPLFGCMPQSVGFAFPSNYKNAFFYYDSSNNPVAAPYKWKWETDSVALPFPAKIHQQLLMFHYSTKQILEGASRPCDYLRVGSDGELRFDCTIGYKGVQHLLMSVNHDLLTDRFAATILRDFNSYESLWSGNELQV